MSREIFSLRKEGRSAEALRLARSGYKEKADDIWFLRAYGWALYDHAKELVDRFDAKELPPAALSSQLSPYMREFSGFGDRLRGEPNFSQMIRLAVKVARVWQDFLAFARWAGTDSFSEQDRQPYLTEDGQKVDSLQKRFVRAIGKRTADAAGETLVEPALLEFGRGVLEQGLRDDPDDQWLNYYQCKFHLARGETDEALRRIGPVLRRRQHAAWTWAQLGEILETSRPEDSLTCLIHATHLARAEQELAKVRVRLAQRLAALERFDEAAQQVKLATQYREQSGTRAPPELQQLVSSDWYARAEAGGSFRPLAKVEDAARAILRELDRQHLTYVRGVIDHINSEKALSYVLTGPSSGLGLPHRKFPEVAALPPGSVVQVGRVGSDGPPMDWSPLENESIPGLCETRSGTLERQEGKAFAFIRQPGDDIYVPNELAQSFAPGQVYKVTCRAIRRANKQGKIGWRAVRVLEEA